MRPREKRGGGAQASGSDPPAARQERPVARTRVAGVVRPSAQATRCCVMGVVNVTPDSFSDGGRFLDPAAAIAHGRAADRRWRRPPRRRRRGDQSAGASRSARTTSSGACCPVIEAARRARRRRGLDRHDQGGGRACGASRRARRSSTTSPVGCSIATWREAVAETRRYLHRGPPARTLAGRGVRGRRLGRRGDEVAAELAERLAALAAVGARSACGSIRASASARAPTPRATSSCFVTPATSVARSAARSSSGRAASGSSASSSAATRQRSMPPRSHACLGAVRAGAFVVRVHNVALLRTALTAYNKE